ncbi:MAG: GNAT family N-acetyltransferase [Dorea sp.]|jgi:GNAT superfamily N-acetyltransferase|nr:GNAT family N-acetyltransferase [Dorea sp.]
MLIIMNQITDIFKDWNESIIWSCVQGVMGAVYKNASNDAAAAVLGDFAFYAGKPCEELLKFKPEGCRQDFIIMVPQNDEWAKLIETCCQDKAKKVSRYAIKKEKDIFDKHKLKQATIDLPDGYELKRLEENEFVLCQNHRWANDLVSQFKDYNMYKKLGLGVAALKDGELAAGASSYSRYIEGIEVQVDTKKEHRRKGLAYACGAKLILECLERGLYPSWDAQNLWSVALAEKLGYHFSHEYIAYEVTGY